MGSAKKHNKLKWVLLGGFAVYLVYRNKSMNGSLKTFGQSSDGWKAEIDTNMAVDMLMLPLGLNPLLRPVITMGARKIVDSLQNKYGIKERA